MKVESHCTHSRFYNLPKMKLTLLALFTKRSLRTSRRNPCSGGRPSSPNFRCSPGLLGSFWRFQPLQAPRRGSFPRWAALATRAGSTRSLKPQTSSASSPRTTSKSFVVSFSKTPNPGAQVWFPCFAVLLFGARTGEIGRSRLPILDG